jgi:MarR family transcriptional regulator, 2-MHQ and catechol-resistance regulon repressor
MSKAIVVPVIRELARCYQAFQRASDAHVRRTGLTPPQFDIVVTLGNTPGLSFKELGSRTLITKGTLTGVVDRLEGRGLVERLACPEDGRSTLVRLTTEGDRLFRKVFEPHLAFLAPAFESMPECGRKELEKRLKQLREALEKRSDELPEHD